MIAIRIVIQEVVRLMWLSCRGDDYRSRPEPVTNNLRHKYMTIRPITADILNRWDGEEGEKGVDPALVLMRFRIKFGAGRLTMGIIG